MKRPIRLRPLRTALAVLALAPLAALAQGGPSRDDEHRPQQRQEQPHGQGQKQGQAGHGGPAATRPEAAGPQAAPQRADMPSRGASGHDSPRAAQTGRHAAGYDFRDQDRSHLQQHYRRSLQSVDRAHRPRFEAGHEIPRAYRGYVTPAPAALRAQLPPPPEGYALGYCQGYTVVYDPTTFVILSVIDLLSR
ncbi:hypothetical protein [Solimonas flava]|uniref:hypothetical protein n=1 Tax=Solimonas flava TaxID=415849 RepID=UPI000400B6BD|nr:hypothetical protein [Solimonas flava]